MPQVEIRPERTFYPITDTAQIEDVVVHCSDPRFQEAFRLFVKNELGIEHPAPIILPGSVSAVGVDIMLPKRLKVFRDQVEFMLEHAKKPRLVLINHEDCKAYSALHEVLGRVLSRKQKEDLLKGATLFKKLVPNLAHVEIYMAELDKTRPAESRVYFEKVA